MLSTLIRMVTLDKKSVQTGLQYLCHKSNTTDINVFIIVEKYFYDVLMVSHLMSLTNIKSFGIVFFNFLNPQPIEILL